MNKFSKWLEGWFSVKIRLNFTIIIGAIGFLFSIEKGFIVGCIFGVVLLLGRHGIELANKYLETKGIGL